jgi:large repetitive protein
MCHTCKRRAFLIGSLLGFLTMLAGPALSRAQTNSAPSQSQGAIGTAPVPRVMIARSTHPLARQENDAGAVDGGTAFERMVLVLGATAQQEQLLQTLLDSQQTKGSSDYHRWLTPEEFGDRFGPSPDDLQRVQAWLLQQGFSVETVAQSRRWIEFSGTSAQVETAFQTKMRHYRVNGELHTANATDISIPASLAPVVRGVASLHDFFSKPLVSHLISVRRDSQGVLVPEDPTFTLTGQSGAAHYLAPGDFASIYNLNPLYKSGLDGTGQTIAIVARSNLELSDVEIFRQIFGLPANDPNIILRGSLPDLLFTDDMVEATLDAEWAGAVAPSATVIVVASASTLTSDGVDLSAAYIVDNNLAGIMSTSFEQCEQNLGPAESEFYNALWQQAAAQGMSVFVASDDAGAAGCADPQAPNNQPAPGELAVNGVASTPFDTAVGGTEFNENGNDSAFWNSANSLSLTSVLGYIPEVVWNESCDPTQSTACLNNSYDLFAGGGGASAVYPKPSWQSAPGVPSDGHRDLPDVSLTAAGGHDGYLFCISGPTGCQTDGLGNLTNAGVVGGTSASSPTFAGIIALVAQQAGGRLGLANYVLYRLASAQQNPSACNSSSLTNPALRSPCVFNDITAGNNSVPGQAGFSAQSGFDLATGLGSVNAANLVNEWNSITFQGSSTTLAGPQTQVQHGRALSLTVTVSPAAGTITPTGSVALLTDKFGPAGFVPLTNGSFVGSVSSLPGGQYNLTAHYQGDETFGSSDSNPIPINISTENSSVALSAFTFGFSGPIPVTSLPYGQYVYFHAQVASSSGNGTPTGTVTFQDGATLLGTFGVDGKGGSEIVSGGFVDYGATISLASGSHSITAIYSGDNSFTPSTSQPFAFTVTKANPTVLFPNTTPLNLAPGQLLPVLVEVTTAGPVVPTGTVQFFDEGVALGNPVTIAPEVSGPNPDAAAQLPLSVGFHSITAIYNGDALYNSAFSIDSLPVTVAVGTGTPSQTMLSGPPGMTTIGQQLVCNVSVTSSKLTPVPTGMIQMNSPLGEVTGPVALQNGSATISFSPFTTGPLTLFAQYSGDSTYAPSESGPVTVTVAKATPSVTLTASASSVTTGSPVNLMTTLVFPAIGIGLPSQNYMVQYSDSLNGASPQPIGGPHFLTFGNPFNGQVYTLVYSLSAVLPLGTHVITAQYLGGLELNAVTANPVTVVVGSSFQISASTNSLTVIAGQSGSVILTVTPLGLFTGATSLSCGSSLPAGATCSVSPNPITPNGSAVTATLTLSTVAPSSPAPQSSLAGVQVWPFLDGGVVLAGLILISRPRRGNMLGAALCIVLSAALFSLGCGGSGSQSSSTPSGPASTTTTLASSGIKTAQGNVVTLTATTSSAMAGETGTVTFLDAGTPIGQPVALSGGIAQVQSTSLSVGTHAITAEYGGDSNHSASTSAILEQVITGTTKIQISASSGALNKSLPLNIVIE